jgi:uncharacterized protein
MALLVNLRHLEAHNLSLQGQLESAELDMDTHDEVIQVKGPLAYDFEVQRLEDGLLLQGRLSLSLECQCVRCLKTFEHKLVLGNWNLHLPLKGEEAAPVTNDCVDLTPYLREDILLGFPQHPLCDPECCGLPKSFVRRGKNTSSTGQAGPGSSAWDELNKLRF